MTTLDLDAAFASVTRETWEALASRSLKGKPLEQLNSTVEGLALSVLYDERPNAISAQTESADTPNKTLGLPNWDNRVRLLGTDIDAYAAHAATSLKGGAASIDIPISLGSLSTHAGVALGDLCTLVDPIQLAIAPITLSPTASVLAFDHVTSTQARPSIDIQLRQIWQQQGLASSAINSAIHFDPISVWLSQGYLHAGLEHELLALAEMVARNTDCPELSLITVHSGIHHCAGATRTEEIAATLATATLYAEQLLAQGVSIEHIASTIKFNVMLDADHLFNVTKLRVLQQLWAHILKNMGADTASINKATRNFIAQTSTRMLGRADLWANHLRHVSAVAAAAMGGAATIIVQPHNYVDGHWCDTEVQVGQRMARNIPIILDAECALLRVGDPLAGSYAIETLTDQLAQAVLEQLGRFATSNGFVDAIRQGHWQKALRKSQAARATAVKDATNIQIGINRFAPDTLPTANHPLTPLPDTEVPPSQSDLIEPLIAKRDAMAVEAVV